MSRLAIKIAIKLLPTVLSLLSPEVIKGAFDVVLDYIEDAVKDSNNKIDDAVVLPLCENIRIALDIEDND